jgi:hypothetical protein
MANSVRLKLKANTKTPPDVHVYPSPPGMGTMHYIVHVHVDYETTGVPGIGQVTVTKRVATLNDGNKTITFQ